MMLGGADGRAARVIEREIPLGRLQTAEEIAAVDLLAALRRRRRGAPARRSTPAPARRWSSDGPRSTDWGRSAAGAYARGRHAPAPARPPPRAGRRSTGCGGRWRPRRWCWCVFAVLNLVGVVGGDGGERGGATTTTVGDDHHHHPAAARLRRGRRGRARRPGRRVGHRADRHRPRAPAGLRPERPAQHRRRRLPVHRRPGRPRSSCSPTSTPCARRPPPTARR